MVEFKPLNHKIPFFHKAIHTFATFQKVLIELRKSAKSKLPKCTFEEPCNIGLILALTGIPKEDAKYLLSIVGIANTIGRIVLGFVADRPWVNRLYLYNTSLAICGLSMALSNFWTSYTGQAIFCGVFGMTSGKKWPSNLW